MTFEMISSWNDITPKGLLTVQILHSKSLFKVRSSKDRRRKVNKYFFSVMYLGVEFRRSIETPTFITPDCLNKPIGAVGDFYGYDCSREAFDTYINSYK